ncbi:hypothetical protein C6Y45_10805 [Alkalicoccus saliphilus]|uniref:Uncharacterized protein n=1 Tax=Alkalicoccus saliphilus TaxID=200989 RepID=A0A2T4U555_9BACI|nr:hypothetical protein C6Y45_10805 [Alkalicoccus saliphilus]
MVLKEKFFPAENFFLISPQQPQGRLLGDQGRGEDPFLPAYRWKELAEPVPPGKRPGRRTQGSFYLYTQEHFTYSLKPCQINPDLTGF